MRTAAVALVAMTSLGAAPAAHAGWDSARATRNPLQPLAAAAPGGVFTVWGTGPGARRLTFPGATTTPLGFSTLSLPLGAVAREPPRRRVAGRRDR